MWRHAIEGAPEVIGSVEDLYARLAPMLDELEARLAQCVEYLNRRDNAT